MPVGYNQVVSSASQSGPTEISNDAMKRAGWVGDRWARSLPGIVAQTNPSQYLSEKYIGAPTKFSDIPQSPVWSDQSIKEGSNALWGHALASVSGQHRDNQNQLAGRYGANSPILAALNQSAYGRAVAGAQEADRGWRMNTGTENARHALQTAMGQTAVESARSRDDLMRRELGTRFGNLASTNATSLMNLIGNLYNTASQGRQSSSISFDYLPS